MDRSELYRYSDGSQYQGMPVERVFEEIKRQNRWIEIESSSGFGSTLEQTAEIVRLMPQVLKQFKIKTLLDVPCGDFNWMKKTDLSGIVYTGADIVKEIVDSNNINYSSSNISFIQMDITESLPGDYDLMLCRDCLVHFSFSDISKTLENIRKSNIEYFMLTTFPQEKENKEIVTGGWRPLNFEIPPLNFPKPLYTLIEKCTEMDGIFSDKSLSIWSRNQIPDFRTR